MQFKKFVADDIRSALNSIKAELGDEAMIVATRDIDGGLFKKARLEVTVAWQADSPPGNLEGSAEAAVNNAAAPGAVLATPSAPPRGAAAAYAAVQANQAASPATNHPRRQAGCAPPSVAERYEMASLEVTDEADSLAAAQAVEHKLDPLRRELKALRNHVHSQDKNNADPVVLRELADLREMLSSLSLAGMGSPALPDPLCDVLAAADVEPQIATHLVDAARARAERNMRDCDAIPKLRDELVALKQVIAAALLVQSDFFAARNFPKRLALIGPTGVGKTTTLAKIAAHAALVHQRSVALISLDTYRIAAFEQLRQYAQLIDVPALLARDAASFAAAIEAHREVDLLLIDTAGRGSADKNHHAQLCELFSQHQVQAYLALATTTRRLELRGILRTFAALDPQGLVFTKLDEAQALGAVLNASQTCHLPVAFVTHGQRVPEDLSAPEATTLAAQLVHNVLDSTRGRYRPAPSSATLHSLSNNLAAQQPTVALQETANTAWRERGYRDHESA